MALSMRRGFVAVKQGELMRRVLGRILVIDDDAAINKVIVKLLERAGFSVVVRESPLGATQAIVNERIDAAVIDWNMPLVRGDDVIRLLATWDEVKDLPVLLISGAPEETLERLRDAGMDSLPGGGAEIFIERVRRIICDHKIDGQEWLDVARVAHQIGMKSNCTMLYGHIETPEDRVDHLIRLRRLQDETGGFVTFIPLAFHPDNTPLHHIPKTTGFDDLKNIAVSRLMLDNIPHIKAYWVMMTEAMAQISQRFGSDDLDGTIVEEKIYHDAGSDSPQETTVAELRRLIEGAGRVPIERDTLYNEVIRQPMSDWRIGQPLALHLVDSNR